MISTIIAWIIFGGLVGWLASIFMGTNKKMGIMANVLVGVCGAFIGGFIMEQFNKTGFDEFSIRNFFVALLGSVLLLGVVKLVVK